MEQDLNHRWQTAEYWVWVATSDRGGGAFDDQGVRSGSAWCARSRTGAIVERTRPSPLRQIRDYHTAAIVPAATDALTNIPLGSTVHIFTDVQYIIDILNTDAQKRALSEYRKKDKSPLAYQADWKLLDAVVAERSLKISSGRPPKSDDPQTLEWKLAAVFANLKVGASEEAHNFNRPFSDWNL